MVLADSGFVDVAVVVALAAAAAVAAVDRGSLDDLQTPLVDVGRQRYQGPGNLHLAVVIGEESCFVTSNLGGCVTYM